MGIELSTFPRPTLVGEAAARTVPGRHDATWVWGRLARRGESNEKKRKDVQRQRQRGNKGEMLCRPSFVSVTNQSDLICDLTVTSLNLPAAERKECDTRRNPYFTPYYKLQHNAKKNKLNPAYPARPAK